MLFEVLRQLTPVANRHTVAKIRAYEPHGTTRKAPYPAKHGVTVHLPKASSVTSERL